MSVRSRFRFRSALALPIVLPALAAIQIAACAGGEDGSTSVGSTSTGAQTGAGGGGQGGANEGGSNIGGSNTGGSAQGSGGSGGSDTGCKTDEDCVKDPAGPICETSTGTCVSCLPQKDKCPVGQYCNPTLKECEVGCTDDTDCTQGGGQHCDVQTHKCVGCVTDANCMAGSICISDTCVPGCSDTQLCQAGFSCCISTCYDLSNNEGHCGDCTTVCSKKPHAAPFCDNGACGMGACEGVWADCDKNPDNGCEWNTLQDGPCACTPNETQSCYFGAPGTMNIGPCKAGTQVCQPDGQSWGPCLGQVLPASEVCANNMDDDCDGQKDNATDADGDGWSTCNGDCCDTPSGCGDPTLVNPGAVEFLNDEIDNDCNPMTSDTKQVVCGAVKFSAVTGDDVAMAMDLCQFTMANPPIADKKWGVISTSQTHADGSIPSAAALKNIQDYQTAILSEYGTGGVVPKNGPTMAGISTGRMRDQNDPGYVAPGGGTSFNVTGSPPAAYLAAHNNKLPSQTDCSNKTCDAGTGANDSLDIKMKIRVPTNAKSFSYDFRFFSAEYQMYTCSIYNDFFITLLQTGAANIPADKNISYDALKNPISVNNGFFDVCVPKGGCFTCPGGSGALQGTGMQVNNTGGATNWLTTETPVIAGETITLDFVLFDVTDNLIDSLVLLDNFRWNPNPPSCPMPPCTHE